MVSLVLLSVLQSLGITGVTSNSSFGQSSKLGKVIKQLTSGIGPDLAPAWGPDGNRIAFHSRRNGNFDIWFIQPDGGSPTQLTTSSLDEAHPSWSLDGKRIAYIRHSEGADRGMGDLFFINTDGSNNTRITNDNTMKFDVTWTPDGNHLVYSEMTGTPANPQVAIWQVNIRTKKRQKLISDVAGGVSVNQAGTLLALDSPDMGAARRQVFVRRLYIWDMAKKTLTPLKTDFIRSWFPAWSPDGTWLAFYAGKKGEDGIWLIKPDGSQKTLLIRSGKGDRFPSWSPDGKRLVFCQGEREDAHLWIFEFQTEFQK
jgi:Tol biopolymer transport system component